ncbi:hypothetical protein [Saccharopolyspora sp. NPDC002376]
MDTAAELCEARTLYDSAGYHEIQPFGAYREDSLTRCYAKEL